MEKIIIRPISDLRTKLTEISKEVHEKKQPVYLTKNGYGDMVIMSMETYQNIIDEYEIYMKMKEAEIYADTHEERLTHEEVFGEMHNLVDSFNE